MGIPRCIVLTALLAVVVWANRAEAQDLEAAGQGATSHVLIWPELGAVIHASGVLGAEGGALREVEQPLRELRGFSAIGLGLGGLRFGGLLGWAATVDELRGGSSIDRAVGLGGVIAGSADVGLAAAHWVAFARFEQARRLSSLDRDSVQWRQTRMPLVHRGIVASFLSLVAPLQIGIGASWLHSVGPPKQAMARGMPVRLRVGFSGSGMFLHGVF